MPLHIPQCKKEKHFSKQLRKSDHTVRQQAHRYNALALMYIFHFGDFLKTESTHALVFGEGDGLPLTTSAQERCSGRICSSVGSLGKTLEGFNGTSCTIIGDSCTQSSIIALNAFLVSSERPRRSSWIKTCQNTRWLINRSSRKTCYAFSMVKYLWSYTICEWSQVFACFHKSLASPP